MTWTENLKFVIQAISHATYDLNNEPYNQRTGLDHLYTELVCYSDPIVYKLMPKLQVGQYLLNWHLVCRWQSKRFDPNLNDLHFWSMSAHSLLPKDQL